MSAPDGKPAGAPVPPSAFVPSLKDLFKPHVDSFNFMMGGGGATSSGHEFDTHASQPSGLAMAVQTLPVMQLDERPESGTPAVRFWIEQVQVGYPTKQDDAADTRLFPNECRERGLSYCAPLMVTFNRRVGDGPVETYTKRMGLIPIMVRSSRCHLQHASKEELLKRHEEAEEQGGYFIVNGNERMVRLLITTKRHYPLAMVRPAFGKRGPEYTNLAVQMRCVRPDQSSKTVTVHYLQTGSLNLRFSYRKNEYFLPVILVLKSLMDVTDRQIYDHIIQGQSSNAFLTDRVELMLRAAHTTKLKDRKAILSYIGKTFRIVLRPENSVSDEQIGRDLIRDNLFVHCCTQGSEELNNKQKYFILIHMIQKCYALAQGQIKPDNPDALHCQEVLLPGHLYNMILKEKLEECLVGIKQQILLDLRLNPSKVQLSKDKYFRSLVDIQKDIGRAIHYFIVTGNLISPSGLDLMQVSGYTVMAEKLNYFRYLSHFRSVHRGQFFTTMKTTEVRKLLPESFGFFCPIHTPDGSPCGLLNHLTYVSHIVTHPETIPFERMVARLVDLGLLTTQQYPLLSNEYVPVLLDGIVVGRIGSGEVLKKFLQSLRWLKVSRDPDVSATLEIYAISDYNDGLYPSVVLYTTPSRIIRPIKYLVGDEHTKNSKTITDSTPGYLEWIGPQEQITMEIAIRPEDYRPYETYHMELSPTNMLSVVASMTPFSDFNQSPRNMYQCQMGKQTMGTPFHSVLHRIDNKVFRLQTPQSPIVRNENYTRFNIDNYPLGTNAVVAVIAYTGYDMEDAMIISRGSYDRGFEHGSVYKYKMVDLSEMKMRGEPIHHRFSNVAPPQNSTTPAHPSKKGPTSSIPGLFTDRLDVDGLPRIGQYIENHDPLYAVHDDVRQQTRLAPHKEPEPARVEDIRLIGDPSDPELQKVGIKYRINRNPVIGDKFASRAGQKGVMSILYPQENMPFTESGMVPDIIINPHAFPSRMTIGMLIESMAGKSGALHGKFQNSTPFQFSEKKRAHEHFGQQLLEAGYNYVGSEPMYSGITGTELRADIFIGLVYYQRLRHMVSDKSQVRATGPVNQISRQPVGGRKVHGGIRFGEMERDSLIGHGTSYLLHDRLMNCSDYHTGIVCTLCGSILSPTPIVAPRGSPNSIVCKNCDSSKGCATVAIPYVFMYLVNELAAMNIRLTLDVKT